MWMLPAGQVWRLTRTEPEDVPPERNSVLHVQSTVDVDHLTGDIGGLLIRQKEDRSGDLRRFRHASDGNGLDDLIQNLFWNLTRHGRFHESRGHRIDGDPLLCGFKREGLGEPDDRGLGRSIVGLSDFSFLYVDRTYSDVQYIATFEHLTDHRLRTIKTGRRVDRDHLLPLIRSHILERPIHGDPGVVHEDVDPPVIFDDPLDQ